ncbi:MAG TPA: homocysteine S-methyltransferase family protein [Allosphingosinicella sp.]|nr:homocysteine S-methyltransferase family protein [Allosphingosinicella sp.]
MRAKYRDALPQLGDKLFLTDGGIETTLIFHQGQELPHFAAFDLMRTPEGRAELARYFAPYVALAKRDGRGLVLESATWRSNPDWGRVLGYTPEALDAVNAAAIDFIRAIHEAEETEASPMVLSGCLGPRGDGYAPDTYMTAEEAEAYHARQVQVFEAAGADMVTAITMTYVEEGIGIARAAKAAGIPAVISFTLETDGRLRQGTSLREAVEACDAATGGYPAYYMVNCAHPSHFRDRLGAGDGDGAWRARIGGLRANASKMSHAELDESPVLDDGDPAELAQDYRGLMDLLPRLNVLGGCCGTDHRHIAAISHACGHVHAA